MKRICMFFVLMLSIICLFTACGDKETNKIDKNDGNKPAVANEAYFKWDDFETTKIIGYTEEGLKQKELTIPAKCTGFGYAALEKNETVEKIYFESEKTVLAEYLFADCTALKYVELSNNIPEIPKGCFNSCSSLEKIVIPDSVVAIGDYSFWQCTSLKSVTLGKDVQKIGKESFMSCRALTTVNFPESLRIIDEYAFAYNENLEQVQFNTGLEKIGEWAFYNCHKFIKVELPESLTTLGTMAFTYCDNLKEIYLPASLQQIEKSSFGQQANVITVYVKQGSAADTQFDIYNDGMMTKKYY